MSQDLRTTLGRVGVWSMQLRGAGRPVVRDAAAELDQLGWHTMWLPGLDGAGVLDDADHLLAAAPAGRMVTGVLAIWGQSAHDLSRRVAALDAVHGPRTVVGLGVGSPESAAAHGQEYGNPLTSMRRYLDALDGDATADGPSVPRERRLLGALGPKMVELAAERTAGWHPFLVTPDYVAAERARVGAGPLVAPHQAVVLEADPVKARAAARAGIGMVLGFPTYRRNLQRIGFSEDDLVPGGSDRLIDALVAWGTLDDLARRVRDHLDAGADHVAVHVLTDPDKPPRDGLPRQEWRELASLLPALTH
jgi:probable F420-dependent oxidoreductase